ncbi:MAG: hypothetical protein IT464_02720 [Planctomycetes bacterium]|nr:hypothetical protein [Planctomycetota bacterium]
MRNWLVVVGLVVAVLVMALGLSPLPQALAQSAPAAIPDALPPEAGYAKADDKLVKARYAQDYPNDVDYIKKGRFYDAGWTRNAAGEAMPGEWRMRVTHIKFDYKDNAANEGVTDYSEGFTLMNSFNHPLDHVKPPENKAKGEWVYRHILNEPAAGRSEPALYVASKQVKVMARIECAKKILAAEIGAKEIRWNNADGSPVDRNWLDLERQNGERKKTMVFFRQVTPGDDTMFVSMGDDGSDYVEFTLMGATKDSIDRSDIVWQWYANNMVQDPMTAAKNAAVHWGAGMEGWQINKSGLYEDIMVDELPVEVVKPHHFYTVLDAPKAPWYQNDHLSSMLYPWVTALDFAIVKIELRGETNMSQAVRKIAKFVYDKGQYDHDQGWFHYLDDHANIFASLFKLNLNKFDFMLTSYIGPVPIDKVNCHDQALAVCTFAALIGADAEWCRMGPFGYVKPANYCGGLDAGDNCNNPFFGMAGDLMTVASDPLVPDSDTMWRLDASGKRKRSMFFNHGWARVDGTIYDATVGDVVFFPPPNGTVNPASSPRVAATLAAYLNQMIDLSHTDTAAWEDNLEVASETTFTDDPPTWTLNGPALDIPDNPNAPKPKYKNGDAQHAEALTFSAK